MTTPSPSSATPSRAYRDAYAAHRAREGRGAGREAELLALPYLKRGPLARQWMVRARSFDSFSAAVIDVRAREIAPRALEIVDLGAGNGWLCYRLARAGHRAVAVDLRTDGVDGLGAARAYSSHLDRMFERVAAPFEAVPLASKRFDIAAFNASIHYANDLAAVLREAARLVRPGGRVVILDSPFYDSEPAGEAMVREKRGRGHQTFGDLARPLLDWDAIEYLTRERLERASAGIGLAWRRRRVRYPLWYELRPVLARVRRRRPPSRFDLWEAVVP